MDHSTTQLNIHLNYGFILSDTFLFLSFFLSIAKQQTWIIETIILFLEANNSNNVNSDFLPFKREFF